MNLVAWERPVTLTQWRLSYTPMNMSDENYKTEYSNLATYLQVYCTIHQLVMFQNICTRISVVL